MMYTIYVGTYASSEASGTYRVPFDPELGALGAAECIYAQKNTKYTAWHDGYLATLTEQNGKAGVALFDTTVQPPTLLDVRLDEQATACWLGWLDGLLYCANYHDGHLLIYEVENRRLRLRRQIFVQAEAGCHQAILQNGRILLPCLCLDQVRIFYAAQETVPAQVLCLPKGSGPRHGVFSPDGAWFYLLSETSNQLFSYQVRGTQLCLRQVDGLRVDSEADGPQSAEVRISPDGLHLYLSIRGTSSLAVFRLEAHLPVMRPVGYSAYAEREVSAGVLLQCKPSVLPPVGRVGKHSSLCVAGEDPILRRLCPVAGYLSLIQQRTLDGTGTEVRIIAKYRIMKKPERPFVRMLRSAIRR